MHRHDADQLIELATHIFGDREKARHWLDRASGSQPKKAAAVSRSCSRRSPARARRLIPFTIDRGQTAGLGTNASFD